MESEISKDERNWAMACHLTTLLGYFMVPFGNIVAPLVIWLIKRQESPFIEDQGRESLNFQISMSIYAIVSMLLCFILVGFALIAAIYVMEIVLVIKAAMQASNGQQYRYPLTIRFLK